MTIAYKILQEQKQPPPFVPRIIQRLAEHREIDAQIRELWADMFLPEWPEELPEQPTEESR